MDLSIYEVIKGPWVTTKAYRLNKDNKDLVVEVHPHANKPMIAKALKMLFDADAVTVRTMIIKGKQKKNKKGVFFSKTRKKAIVTLKEGQFAKLAGGLSVPVHESSASSGQ